MVVGKNSNEIFCDSSYILHQSLIAWNRQHQNSLFVLLEYLRASRSVWSSGSRAAEDQQVTALFSLLINFLLVDLIFTIVQLLRNCTIVMRTECILATNGNDFSSMFPSGKKFKYWLNHLSTTFLPISQWPNKDQWQKSVDKSSTCHQSNKQSLVDGKNNDQITKKGFFPRRLQSSLTGL